MAYIQYYGNIIRQTSDRVLHHPILFAGQGVRYRKLEVILTTTIDKLGKAGETVKVAPGHFRNHLMPKLLAVPNIDKFAHLISEQRKPKRDLRITNLGSFASPKGLELSEVLKLVKWRQLCKSKRAGPNQFLSMQTTAQFRMEQARRRSNSREDQQFIKS